MALGLAAGLAMLTAPNAHAIVELKLSDGLGHSVDILDGGLGDSFNNNGAGVQDGVVQFNGSLGLWKINTSTAFSGGVPILDLVSANRTCGSGGGAAACPSGFSGAGTLTILASDSGFTPASNGFTFDVGGTTTTPGTLIFKAFGGTSNNKFDMTGNQIGSTLTFTTASYHQTIATTSPVSVSPYSLTLFASIDYGRGKGAASFDSSLTANPVPEPAVVTMLGGVLLLTVGAIRRKASRA
jgi:hypothetical protein